MSPNQIRKRIISKFNVAQKAITDGLASMQALEKASTQATSTTGTRGGRASSGLSPEGRQAIVDAQVKRHKANRRGGRRASTQA